MSVRDKVGQLIMPWLLGNYVSTDGDAFAAAAEWVDELGVGGITISVGSPMDAAAKLNALQRRSRLPLIVAADLEYGAAMRMVGATGFPMPMAVGATDRELDAYQLGRITALEARAVGIHWTFSPVADVNNNPDNPIINTRSFGESPEAVARLVAAYVRGASEHGLLTTAKHFPGHGDTGTDSHLAMPVLDVCWNRLDTLELTPFRAAIEAGVTSVMTAHVALPCFDSSTNPKPATFLPDIMTGVLRDSLGFDGLAVTDALTMGAIVSRYGAGESAVLAFLAGSDLLLIPDDIGQAMESMVAAVESGRITTDRLDRSVLKILSLKEEAGLFAKRTVVLDSIPVTVGRREHQTVANNIARRALTLIQAGPIEEFRDSRDRVALITYAEETNHSIGNLLIRELRALGDTVTPFRLFPASGAMSYDSARAVIDTHPRAIFATSVRPISGRGHVDLPEALATLIRETDEDTPTTLVSFGSPYLLNQLTSFDGAYLLAWNAVGANERAVAHALAGETAIVGTSPITLSDRFPRGFGITIPSR
jgi:beta-glucosidase-like glycosyl hydrolase